MLDILTRNFGPGQDIRFEWRTLNNPVGQAWAWFAYDKTKKNTVATASVFPRRMWVNGKSVVCGAVGAFAVDASHRSLGPAVLLQRTTFEPVNSGALSFCYDSPPHDRGMSTFVRLGMRPSCEVTRYVLLLRSGELIQKRLGKGFWTRPIIAMANVVLAASTRKRGSLGVEVSEFQGSFDEEFSDLDRRVGSSGIIRAARTADLLNWRYRQNPASDTEVLIARRLGQLQGFLAIWRFGEVAHIVDLFGLHLSEIAPALLDAAIEICKRKKTSSIHAYYSSDSELMPVFERFGFRARERDARVVTYESPSRGTDRILRQGLLWNFSYPELLV